MKEHKIVTRVAGIMDDDIKLELYTLDEPSMENTVIVETINNSVYGVSPKRVKHCNNTTSESNSESAVSNGGVACVSVAMYQDDTIPNGHSLFELYQQRLFCDITLVAGDKTRFVNRWMSVSVNCDVTSTLLINHRPSTICTCTKFEIFTDFRRIEMCCVRPIQYSTRN